MATLWRRRLREKGPGWLLLGAPFAGGAFVVSLVAPLLQPRETSIDPALLKAMLETGPAAPLRKTAPVSPPAPPTLPRLRPAPVADLEVPAAAGQPTPTLEIRVMLQRAQANVSVGASGDWQLQDRQGAPWRRSPGVVSMTCGDGGLSVDGTPAGAELWAQPLGSVITVQGQRYRGSVRLFCDADGVTAVNHLPLESYIGSVVGAEMPSYWPAEALRAQAVAARSYAMAHLARPADPHWHLGATTRWQAYQGLDSESSASTEAARSTAGLILSYKGGIVESLYASDRALALEAHGHLGASMSQQGARMLAERGYRFSQILATYYQGASLARLQPSA
ncbi:MAG: SpoIID/LytB domain-containing protein [Synechococcus sp.]